MSVPRGGDARKQPGIVSTRVINAQPVLEIRISAWVGCPTFRILPTTPTRTLCLKKSIDHVKSAGTLPERMTDVPLRCAEPFDPQTFHVQYRSRVYDQSSLVALCYWSQLMAKQYCWRFFHLNTVQTN